MGPAALDPRLEGTGSGRPELPGPKPVASADDVTAAFGDPVTMDGSASRAAPGRVLTSFEWAYRDKETSNGDRET